MEAFSFSLPVASALNSGHYMRLFISLSPRLLRSLPARGNLPEIGKDVGQMMEAILQQAELLADARAPTIPSMSQLNVRE